VSPSLLETNSEQRFQTPKISKTYIDFKKTLSEDESENFFGFVKEAIKNFQQPIQDLEAWLASQTKAGQNRWQVYYQKYQKENKARKADSDSTSVSDGARQRAIANYQKQLNQEKTGQTKTGNEVFTSEFNRLLDNPDNQIKRIDQLESRSKPITKPFGRYVSESCEQLRNLRMKSLFAHESIQGGMA
jgi:molecular chaperone GrpE (heat shock protein)